MKKTKVKKLERIANTLREDVVNCLCCAGSGHIGASLGLADLFAVLYFCELKHNPSNPNLKNRDKLILSIGHVAPILYASLANSGYFPKSELSTLRKTGSCLQGHPHKDAGLPGIETSSGSLGQGLSIAAGMAMADKIDDINRRVFCIMGDGEVQEGQIWEAAMSISYHKLNNIVGIIDRNYVQIDGKTKDVMDIEPLKEKWTAFGWQVSELDGNNIQELLDLFDKLTYNKPNLIIAKTIMGKSIPEIENDYNWHGKAPNKNQANRFLYCLKT